MAETNIESLKPFLAELDNQANNSPPELDEEANNIKKLKKMIKKLMVSDSAESQDARAVIEELYKMIGQLQTEITRLSQELERLEYLKKRDEKKLEKKKSEVNSLRLQKCEVEIDILSLLRNEIAAVLDPSDQQLRNKIESVFGKRIDEAKSGAYKCLPDDVEAMIKGADRLDRRGAFLIENDDVAGQSGWELTWCDVIRGIGGALAAVCKRGTSSKDD